MPVITMVVFGFWGPKTSINNTNSNGLDANRAVAIFVHVTPLFGSALIAMSNMLLIL